MLAATDDTTYLDKLWERQRNLKTKLDSMNDRDTDYLMVYTELDDIECQIKKNDANSELWDRDVGLDDYEARLVAGHEESSRQDDHEGGSSRHNDHEGSARRNDTEESESSETSEYPATTEDDRSFSSETSE